MDTEDKFLPTGETKSVEAYTDEVVISPNVRLNTWYITPGPLLEPKEDITAFELATILPFCFSQGMTEKDWEKLGSAQRHLRRHDLNASK